MAFKILNLTNENIEDDISIKVIRPEDGNSGFVDVVVCDERSVQNVDDIKQYGVAIAAIDSNNDIFDPSKHLAWIKKEHISSLAEPVNALSSIIETKKQLFEIENELKNLKVHSRVNTEHIEIIVQYVRESTTQIKETFVKRVEEMKEIHASILETRTLIDESERIEDMEAKTAIINQAATDTDEILFKTDGIINSMYSFITILQCEDRITQMLDGIANVMKNDASKIDTFIKLPEEEDRTIKESMVRFYTIQEQRDNVMGIDSMTSCYSEDVSIDDIVLF